ncbi:MAG: hypothetical protein GY940_45930, partial [bacterium]|nr:hypothetical protein [bacterium]
NTGTWFVGKLQADIDRERVIEGLRGVLDASGDSLDSLEINALMSGLKKRVFMVKNVHEPGVRLFQTRWAISYLAGPLTRDQLKEMKKASPPEALPSVPGSTGSSASAPAGAEAPTPTRSDLLPFPPQFEMALEQVFESSGDSADKAYSPYLYLQGEVVFDDNKLGIYVRKKYYSDVALEATLDWGDSQMTEEPEDYSSEPDSPVQGFEIIETKLNYTTLRRMQTGFKNYLFSQLVLKLFVNRTLKMSSEVDETEDALRTRCRDVVEKTIDKEIEKLKDK